MHCHLKVSVMREHDHPVKNSQTPNKFGTQKFPHQIPCPVSLSLAKVSGMSGFRINPFINSQLNSQR